MGKGWKRSRLEGCVAGVIAAIVTIVVRQPAAELNEAAPVAAPLPDVPCGGAPRTAAERARIASARLPIAARGGPAGTLARRRGRDGKAQIRPLFYAAAIVLGFFVPILSCVLHAALAALWFEPDRRIEGRI